MVTTNISVRPRPSRGTPPPVKRQVSLLPGERVCSVVRKRPRTKSADDEDDSVFGVVVVDVNDHGLLWMRIAWGSLWVAMGNIMSCRPVACHFLCVFTMDANIYQNRMPRISSQSVLNNVMLVLLPCCAYRVASSQPFGNKRTK